MSGSPKPEEWDFQEFDKPRAGAYKAVQEAVSHWRTENDEVFLDVILAATNGSYRAVCLLNASSSEERFAPESYTLSRSMLEAYFALLFWLQNPRAHETLFWKSAWLDHTKELELNEKLLEFDPLMKQGIDEMRQFGGEVLMRVINLSQAEICGAVPIEGWPWTPGKMMKGRYVGRWRSPRELEQARRLRDLLYPTLSRMAHPSWLSLAMRSSYAESKKLSQPEPRFSPRSSESDAAFYAMLVITMVLAELDAYLGSNQRENIKSMWKWLIGFRPHARIYYEARFKDLLGDMTD